MAMTKNKSTKEGKEFWDHCERVAAEVRQWPAWIRGGKVEQQGDSKMGCDSQFDTPKKYEEPRTACGAMIAGENRERRERPRMSDIERSVEKRSARIFQKEMKVDPELEKMLAKAKPEFQTAMTVTGVGKQCTYGPEVNPESEDLIYKGKVESMKVTQPVGADKNSPESLKILRWAIYELIESYEADYSKTISGILKQEVERLFKEYTHS